MGSLRRAEKCAVVTVESQRRWALVAVLRVPFVGVIMALHLSAWPVVRGLVVGWTRSKGDGGVYISLGFCQKLKQGRSERVKTNGCLSFGYVSWKVRKRES